MEPENTLLNVIRHCRAVKYDEESSLSRLPSHESAESSHRGVVRNYQTFGWAKTYMVLVHCGTVLILGT